MKVTCILCEKTEELNDKEFKTKRLRNKPICMYLCKDCDCKITKRALARKRTPASIQPRPKSILQLKKEMSYSNNQKNSLSE